MKTVGLLIYGQIYNSEQKGKKSDLEGETDKI